MRISEIYEKNKILPNLQTHMLRVAGVTELIAKNFDKEVNKSNIVAAGLLHDIGNIVKFMFDSNVFPDSWFLPEGKDYWVKVQEEFIIKYGQDDHVATIRILEELKIPQYIIDLIDSIGFANSEKIRASDNFEVKILAYADQRVSPQGVVSMDKRHDEARKRYATKANNKYSQKEFLSLIAVNKEVEKQIFKHCDIKPEDINPGTVEPLLEKLADFEIETD